VLQLPYAPALPFPPLLKRAFSRDTTLRPLAVRRSDSRIRELSAW
jgi:hypothetical protein